MGVFPFLIPFISSLFLSCVAVGRMYRKYAGKFSTACMGISYFSFSCLLGILIPISSYRLIARARTARKGRGLKAGLAGRPVGMERS